MKLRSALASSPIQPRRSERCERSGTIISSVCVDASFLVKVPVPEQDSALARSLWRSWLEGSTQRLAPSLVKYEFMSILRQKLMAGQATDAEAERAVEFVLANPLVFVTSEDMHRRAWRLARELALRSTYDAHYLAVADEYECELWTADRTLYTAVRERFPLIRLLGAATA